VRVLISDGAERASLAAARSLVALGCEVHVSSPNRLSLAGVSRGVHPAVMEGDPLRAPAEYAAELGELARRRDLHMILPVTDASVEAALEFRSAIPDGVVLPMPGLQAYRRASDKHQMLACALAAGLDIPETVVLVSRADCAAVPGPAFFPAFVKPHRSVVSGDGPALTRHKLGVVQVHSVTECVTVLASLPDAAFPVLLQRRVSGPGEGWFALRWNGRYVAEFAHRRLREKPPGGGVSVYRESIEVPPALGEAGRKLLDRLDWQGVAMIECKLDQATGRHVFMEINGRLWGSLQLAIDAGVDFPALLMGCALGEEVTPVRTFRTGVRSSWFWGEVDHLYLRLKRGPGAPHSENGELGRLRALRDFLTTGLGQDREEIWRLLDPGPFLLETAGRLGLLRSLRRNSRMT
jgi:predicted ATP-grasp superfamily ATP-dependent carboligase